MTSILEEDLRDSHFIRNSILYMNDPMYSYILNHLDCEVIICSYQCKCIHHFTFNNTNLFKWLKQKSIHYIEVSKNVIISTHQYQIDSLIKDKNFDKLDTIFIYSPTNLLVTNTVSKTFKQNYTSDFYKYLAHKINCNNITVDLKRQIYNIDTFKELIKKSKINFKNVISDS